MRPRWRKVLADLWGNLTRFVLVTLSLTVGLFSLGMIVGGYLTTLEDMETGFRQINPADLRLRVDGFDDNLLERIRRLEGVDAAEGEKRLFLQLLAADGDWQNLVIRVFPESEQHINLVELLDGRMPNDREIILDVHREFDFQIGDRVLIQTPAGLQRSFTLTGTVRDQTIGVTGTSYFVAPIHGYITFETLPWLQEEMFYDVLLVKLDSGLEENAINKLSNQITGIVQQSGRSVYSITNLMPVTHPNQGYVSAVSGLLALLGFLSVFLSGFLVFNAMAALFTQHLQYIGIMKAIGAQRGDIIRMYTAFIFVFGMIALGIAIPASAWASAALGDWIALRMNFRPGGFQYVPLALILQGVIALLSPQIAGILPILKASKVSVQEAITSTGIDADDFGKNWVDRKLEKIKRLSRPLLISLRNTFRRKGRLVLTLITLSLGGAVFIATFNVRASIESYIEKVSRYMLADVNLEFGRPYRANQIQRLGLSVNGVASIEPRAVASGNLLNEAGDAAESVEMIGADPESDLIEPILLRGRWLIPGDKNAIVLNEGFLSRYPEIEVGEIITLKVNRRDIEWTVVGFFQFIGSDYFLAYVPFDYLNQITGTVNQSLNYQVVAQPGVVEKGFEDELARRLDQLYRARGFAIRSAASSKSIRGHATLGLDTLTVFLLIMSGLTALVGSISLTGTMGMNVMERTREIGVMRAIGATDRQVMNLIIVEGVAVGMISWLFGVIFAFPISYLMSYIINMSVFGTPGEFTFTLSGFVIWLGVVLVLSMLASILPARKAARLTIREVLSYE